MSKNNILALLIASMMITSCTGDFLKEYSQDLARVQSVDDLNELLVGDCYLPLSGHDASSDSYVNYNYMLVHFMGDELEETLGVNDIDQINARNRFFPYFTWQQDCNLSAEGKNEYEDFEALPWDLGYTKINNCNMVLAAADDLGSVSEKDEALLRHIRGEAYFLRADYYFMLVNLYGKPYSPSTAETTPGVPIKTSESIEDKEFERSSVAAVYEQINSDLSQAENYLNDVLTPTTIYHVGLNAVYLLRSRVALYMQDWNTAKKYAELSLQQNSSLQSPAGFTESYPISSSNPEVIYSNGASMFGNIIFTYPRLDSWYREYVPTWHVSDHLYNLFDDNDLRKTSYITTEDDIYYHNPTYHKIDNSQDAISVYKTVSDVFSLRSAEAYLNLAEAEAQLGNDAAASQTLTRLRKERISGDASVNLTGNELITFIREERERELCFEGHRWFDLRRYMVDEKCPYTTTITHTMSYWDDEDDPPIKTEYYRLEKNDAAYTLNIPKTVRDFQPSIGTNERPARQPYQTDADDDNSGDDDDWDW